MKDELSSERRDKARLVVIGGFPGAGKTRAIIQVASVLRTRNHSCAVITNDHGSELVDNTLLEAEGIRTEAVEGGDLCTQAEETFRAAARLQSEQAAAVIIAEPAGTCADLFEALLLPAKSVLGSTFSIAPLTVVVDSIRAGPVLGLEAATKFTTAMRAVYQKQIAEAEIILINNAAGSSPKQLAELRGALLDICPQAKIFSASAFTASELNEWIECLMTKESSPPAPEILDRPAPAHDPEALLAWLNSTVSISSVRYFEAGKLLLELAACIQSLLQHEGGEIAHLKIAFKPDFQGAGIAAVSLARLDASPQLLRDVSEPIQRGELILNARAGTDPEILHSVVNRALLALMEHSPELFARMRHSEHFKAGLSSRSALDSGGAVLPVSV